MKEQIFGMLCYLSNAMKLTRQWEDLDHLSYDGETETVTAHFEHGTKKVSVAGDSGAAMIRDIVNHLV